jgi:murein DD-endopeptidase MepM/ murein hydrolase activator NlpD
VKRKHHKKRTRPTATPTATPTPTPALNLTTENSISPVTCNGPARPPAAHPFLASPYRGWTSIVSYFDHDLPDFSQDGLVITSNGMEARPDALHRAADFPAYWNGDLRQYLYYDGHNGYDYDLYYQPVFAAAAGKVIYAALEYSYAPRSGYGNMVMINDGHGYVTLYGHFSKILVKKGERVKRGQEIGISGNTGHSSGPHLHFTVFHNCTPTDPYGWSGPGDDPLAGYQGEHAENLWVQAPLVTNPLPDWPGVANMTGPGLPRLVLLRLPATKDGTTAFTHALQTEASKVERALQAEGGITSFDPLRGAVRLLGPVPPARVYALSEVASIGSTDVAADARGDVLHALALAALATKHKEIGLDRSRRWTGYLLRWGGQTFLVGRGERGKAVKLQLPLSKTKRLVRHVEADPASGAYAVDLGNMSPQQMTALFSNLRNANRRKPTITVQRERQPPKPPRVIGRKTVSASDADGPLVAFVVLSIVVAAAVFGVSRRRSWLPAGASASPGEARESDDS